MSPFADLAAPASFWRFVSDDLHAATCSEKAADHDLQQVSTDLQRRPASAVEHLLKPAKLLVQLMPLCRSAAVTVRRPRAHKVPISKVTTFFHVGALNSG